MDNVRFGIVGVGAMGKTHVQNFLNNKVTDGILTAVYDIEPSKLEWLKNENVKIFDSAVNMFKSGEIDAVLIATTHYFHPPIAMEAFCHNLHVMIEKPAGVYTSQVKEMNEAAAKADVEFGIMFQKRTEEVFRKMREIVKGGIIGEIRRTNWIVTDMYRPQAYYDSNNWRGTWKGEGGGVLLNQCPHYLDMWQWICGMPHKVTAFVHEGKRRNIEADDEVTAYVEYPNGATGVFVASVSEAPGSNRFEIVGDNGKLLYNDGKLELIRLKDNEEDFNKDNKEMFGTPSLCRKQIVKIDCKNPSHPGVLSAFVDKILGRGEQYASGEEGINSLMLSNAMYLSSWLGKTIPLPLDEELFLEELRKKYR